MVGKLCSDHVVGKEIMRSTMAKLWRIRKAFVFHNISPNPSAISFKEHMDLDRVLVGKPWLFDNNLFIPKPFEGLTPANLMNFDYEEF